VEPEFLERFGDPAGYAVEAVQDPSVFQREAAARQQIVDSVRGTRRVVSFRFMSTKRAAFQTLLANALYPFMRSVENGMSVPERPWRKA